MQEATIDADQVRFTDEGPKGSRPVVLVHGFPLDSNVWRHQVVGLVQSGHRVICPDLPGFGQSQAPKPGDPPMSLDSLAEALRELLRQQEALPCVLAGLSMGGYVAFALARQTPGALAGLVLVDTKPTADNDQQKQARNDMAALARAEGAGAVAERMLGKVLAEPHRVGPVSQEVMRMMSRQPPETVAQACEAMRDRPDSTPLLATLPMPVLWLTGEQDELCPPEQVREWAALTPGAKATVIPDAGHLTPIENPAAVTTAVRTFVDGL
ncbi:MAG: alpha/beta fold hydrolase [Phycisphaerae bacterium]